MEQLTRQLKALADPSRLQILRLLRRDLCVGALAQSLNLSEAAISQHLKILREEGFIRGEKRSYWTHYRVEDAALRDVAADLTEMAEACAQSCAHPCTPSSGHCPALHEEDDCDGHSSR